MPWDIFQLKVIYPIHCPLYQSLEQTPLVRRVLLTALHGQKSDSVENRIQQCCWGGGGALFLFVNNIVKHDFGLMWGGGLLISSMGGSIVSGTTQK